MVLLAQTGTNNNNWTPVGIPNGVDCVLIPVTARNPIVWDWL